MVGMGAHCGYSDAAGLGEAEAFQQADEEEKDTGISR